MGKRTLLQFVKDIVYRAILPIFLWSTSFKTLDEYIADIFFVETGGYPEWYKQKLVLPRVSFSVENPFVSENKHEKHNYI